jgi:hypothetical protein
MKRLIKIGRHKILLSELYSRVINKIPKAQFASIIKKIRKDLDKELA